MTDDDLAFPYRDEPTADPAGSAPTPAQSTGGPQEPQQEYVDFATRMAALAGLASRPAPQDPGPADRGPAGAGPPHEPEPDETPVPPHQPDETPVGAPQP
ncbi:MAG: hypothetical protein ACRDJU_05315, partial [Actinomycetota bacterium]